MDPNHDGDGNTSPPNADGRSSASSPDFRVIMAPEAFNKPPGSKTPSLFLSGSIDKGEIDWRKTLTQALKGHQVTILNPHNEKWDRTWVEDIEFEPFRTQIFWELNNIESTDLAVVYFGDGTEAPITLMEFGLLAKKGSDNVKVCCRKGYKKRGNVQVACAKYNFELVSEIPELIKAISKRLQEW